MKDRQPPHQKKLHRKKIIAGLICLAAVVLVAVFAFFFAAKANSPTSLIRSDRYQAVFLSNGQAYFGKLNFVNNDYARLQHVFYLQTQQHLQQTGGEQQPETQNDNAQLAKLGGELHGPEDAMYIDRKQILFWENLRSDSKVTEAIDAYRKN